MAAPHGNREISYSCPECTWRLVITDATQEDQNLAARMVKLHAGRAHPNEPLDLDDFTVTETGARPVRKP